MLQFSVLIISVVDDSAGEGSLFNCPLWTSKRTIMVGKCVGDMLGNCINANMITLAFILHTYSSKSKYGDGAVNLTEKKPEARLCLKSKFFLFTTKQKNLEL